MRKIQAKIALKSLVEDGNFYSRNVTTLSKEIGLTPVQVIDLAREAGYNLFYYRGSCYVGTKLMRHHFYDDKLRGQNPFYQTS